jgi:putative ABC transport system ATP-binding protein
MMSNHLIEIKNLHKHYVMPGFTVKALDGVDITVDKGEYVALVGPSGSGKSTLMNMIGCLDAPTSGKYTLNGIDLSKQKDNQLAQIRNREVGFVFQTFNLMGNMSALDNVALPAKYRKKRAKECRQMAKQALTDVGLGERIYHLPNELSGGQQQRVAFARALLCNPPLLLADEPTGNLDSKTGKELLALMEQLNAKGTTLILITHDQSIADKAHRKISMLDGKIVSDTRSGDARAGDTKGGKS